MSSIAFIQAKKVNLEISTRYFSTEIDDKKNASDK